MVSFRAISILLVVVLALFTQTYARTYDLASEESEQQERLKRQHGEHGVTGPVHTFVKTDKHANFKWGVRHHVGHHYAGH